MYDGIKYGMKNNLKNKSAKHVVNEFNKHFDDNVSKHMVLGSNKTPDNYRAEGWFQAKTFINSILDAIEFDELKS